MTAQRAETAIPQALELVDAVRRFDRGDVRHIIATADLPALAVALAAMVDQDRSLTDLLGWTEEQDGLVDGWRWPDVLAAHAEWEAYRYRGIPAPEHVADGQRVYDRVRARRRRADAKAGAA